MNSKNLFCDFAGACEICSGASKILLGDENSSEVVRYAPQATHSGAVRTSRYLMMSDGTKIVIDLWFAASRKPTEKLPGILYQTRYWRSMEIRWPFSWVKSKLQIQGKLGEIKLSFLNRGYAWVDVDTRGSGASFGDRPWDYSPLEIRDGNDVVNWIIAQPWSTGVVGSAGAAYSGGMAEFPLHSGLRIGET